MSNAAKLAALQYLAQREYALSELSQKLKRKGFSDTEINHCLAEMQSERWQSDQRYASSYARQKANAGYGPLRIRLDLQQKQIATELIEAALNQEEINWLARLEEVIQKKTAGKLPTDPKQKAKLSRFLYQRGYSAEAIKNCLNIDD